MVYVALIGAPPNCSARLRDENIVGTYRIERSEFSIVCSVALSPLIVFNISICENFGGKLTGNEEFVTLGFRVRFTICLTVRLLIIVQCEPEELNLCDIFGYTQIGFRS